MTEEDFMKVFKSWEYDTLQACFEDAVSSQGSDFGLVFVFIDNLEDMLQLPSYETIYYLEGKELSEQEVNCLEADVFEAVMVERRVTHYVSWTECLNITNNHHLCLQYLKDHNGVKEVVDFYTKLLKSTPKYEFKHLELKGV